MHAGRPIPVRLVPRVCRCSASAPENGQQEEERVDLRPAPFVISATALPAQKARQGRTVAGEARRLSEGWRCQADLANTTSRGFSKWRRGRSIMRSSSIPCFNPGSGRQFGSQPSASLSSSSRSQRSATAMLTSFRLQRVLLIAAILLADQRNHGALVRT